MNSSTPSPDTVLEVFDTLGPPGTPFTTPEVAEEFDCTDRTIYNKLNTLVEEDAIQTKKVGAKGRVWWKSINTDIRRNGGASDLAAPVSLRNGQSPTFFSDSEMAERLREFDWAETSLGPIAEWPQELRFAVDIMLGADEAIGVYWGDDLTLLYNDAWHTLIGDKHPAALGQPAREVFPEIWEMIGPMFTDVLDGKGAALGREQLMPLTHNGHTEDAWFDYSANPILLTDGSVRGIFNIAIDSTDRVLAEKHLREANERFQVALTAAEMGTWEWNMDKRTVRGDDTMLSLFELPPSDEPVPVEQFLETMSTEGVAQCEAVMESTFEPGEEIQDEIRLDHVDDPPRWVTWRGRASKDDPSSLRGVSFDVTEQKQAELERESVREQLESDLVKSEGRLDAFVTATSDIVYRMSPDWSEMYYLDGREFIVDTDHPRETWLTEYIPNDEQERVMDAINEAIETKSMFELEHQVLQVDGTRGWVHSRAVPRLNDGGEITEWFGTASDITERKQRAQRDQFLLALSDRIRDLTSQEAIGEACTQLLAEELNLDRAYFVRFDPDNQEALVGPEYHSPGLDPVSGLYPFSAFPEAIQQIHSETPVYNDVANDSTLPEAEKQALLELDFGAWIGAPIRRDAEKVDWALYAVTSKSHNWSDTDVSLVEEAADRAWTAVERARAEQSLKQSNQSLERLNDVSRELIEADPEAISSRVAERTVDILDVEYAALWRYDKQTGDIELHAEHSDPDTDLSAVRPAEVSRDHVWETFIGDDIHVDNALDIADGEPWPSGLGSRVFIPLGRHGVICVGSIHSETFDEPLLDLMKMIASTVETAWDRAESEQELERKNEELTRLDNLNALIRAIDQALVDAQTVDAIDEAVCEQLANSALFEFAWVGEFDADDNAIDPRAWAGVDSRSLDDLTTKADRSVSDRNPFTTAIQTKESQVVNDIATDVQAAPWREVALDLGARSCVCLPLVYDDFIYGILSVYKGTPQHDERDINVLSELGRTIAHAIHAVETRELRHMDRVVELTLRSATAETPLCQLARETGCVLKVTDLVPGSNGETTMFFTATDISSDELVTAIEQSPAIEELICLSEHEDGSLFKAQLAESQFTSWFLDRDAMMHSLTIDAGTATLVVDVPMSVDIRSFVEAGQQAVDDFELLARRTRTRSPDTAHSLQTAFTDRLTDRQREILQLAYRSGFFESPRLQTGHELSTALDLSQSTFNYHLRGAERRLLEVVFDSA